MDKIKSGPVTIFRYLSLAMTAAELFLIIGSNTERLSIMMPLFLMYVVNVQSRYFTVTRSMTYILSLFIDCFLLVLLQQLAGITFVFIGLLVIVDAFSSFQAPKALLCSSFLVFAEIIGFMNLTNRELLDTVWLKEVVLYSSIAALITFLRATWLDKQCLQEENSALRQAEHQWQKKDLQMQTYLQTAQEMQLLKERNRISRDLHDSVGHTLSTLTIQLGAIEQLTKENNPQASKMTASLKTFTVRGLQEVREVLSALKPSGYNQQHFILSLKEMLEEFRLHTGVKVNFGYSPSPFTLNEQQEETIYRVTQEFLSNSVKHGQAKKVTIFLNVNDEEIILTLKDNGAGTTSVVPHIGLLSIRERVQELGGDTTIKTALNEGFQLQIYLPKSAAGSL